MKVFSVDLHVHIGRARGKPVKIAASKDLTVENILNACSTYKGIDVVGIVDSASGPVLEELCELLDNGKAFEHRDGGIRYKADFSGNVTSSKEITLILGAEVEVTYRSEPFHMLVYFPFLKVAREFHKIMRRYIRKIDLSSQRADIQLGEFIGIVESLNAVLIPAHAFTPHKGVYGKATDSLSQLFGSYWKQIPAIELGLSADTFLADLIPELSQKTFLSNSDAHSLQRIAREHNLIEMEEPTFKELMLALRGEGGRRIILNVGLDPRLGKYHRSYCRVCKKVLEDFPPPVLSCPYNPNHEIVRGVLDRIVQIGGRLEPVHPPHRPPYLHQVPLDFLPGLGKATYWRLMRAFGNEMKVIHEVPVEAIKEVAGTHIATYIKLMREGRLKLEAGGGGIYGKVSSENVLSQMSLF